MQFPQFTEYNKPLLYSVFSALCKRSCVVK